MYDASALIDLLGGTTCVARKTRVRPPSVHEWRKKRSIPLDKLVLIACEIEQASGMEIRRWQLCPDDWRRIWPELIGTDGAPDLPPASAQPAQEAA